MKSEQIIIDVEVVRDWNWVKCGVKRGYYRVRNLWWDVKYGVKDLVMDRSKRWRMLERFFEIGFILCYLTSVSGMLYGIAMTFGVEMAVVVAVIFGLDTWSRLAE